MPLTGGQFLTGVVYLCLILTNTMFATAREPAEQNSWGAWINLALYLIFLLHLIHMARVATRRDQESQEIRKNGWES